MLHRLPRSLRSSLGAAALRAALVLVFLSVAVAGAWAKDAPITGVMLSGAGDSMTYAQVTGFLVNGKTELRACNGTGGIDKSAYKNLAKVNLTSLKSLERLADGSMVAESAEGASTCVVPSNFKFEKDGLMTPADLAEKSAYTGQVVGSSPAGVTALPPFAPGVKLVFVTASDSELAQYLLAQRADTMASWQTYLGLYAAGAHLTPAKAGLVALFVKDGSSKLNVYKSSSVTAAPTYGALKDAKDRSDQALTLVPGDDSATRLQTAVRAELKTICDKGSAKLQAYQIAVGKKDQGYALLVSAKDLSDHVAAIDPKFPQGVALAASVNVETRAFEMVITAANGQVSSSQFDQAYDTIGKYLAFLSEEPRLKAVVDADYQFHLKKGTDEANTGAWVEAVADLTTASTLEPTDDAKASLVSAQAGLLAMMNKQAADKALGISKDRVEAEDAIGAYEVLADLNEAQRLLVKDQMVTLQDAYVQRAMAKAKELQAAHTPIRGRADEDGVRQAYLYLQRASKLNDNPELGLKLDLVADMISGYYVDLGKKYLGRPLSSGVGLGWSYLTEASQYKSNLDSVRDAMTTSNAAYQMRAKLSIGVLFRDQTSRRDSAGFADQLQQAFATGIETSGLPAKVILPGQMGAIEPNFQFVGEILQHRTIRNAKKETMQSQYRSGSREIPNEAWNKADQEFEGANLQLQKAQSALAAAQAKNNKKQIEDADKSVSDIQATVQAARSKMNATPRTLSDDVLSPYNYTQTTLELTNIVELSFRILDASGGTLGEPIRVMRGDKPRKFTILDNIKPDDTKGLKEIDAAPDETQLMTDIEIEARDAMVKEARDRVKELPEKVLAQARGKAASNDMDGAGEAYVLYLNCTPAEATPARVEAIKFLSENFNIRNTVNLRAALK